MNICNSAQEAGRTADLFERRPWPLTLTRKTSEQGQTAYTASNNLQSVEVLFLGNKLGCWHISIHGAELGIQCRCLITVVVPVKNGMTFVPPPTAVMTSELPKLHARQQ